MVLSNILFVGPCPVPGFVPVLVRLDLWMIAPYVVEGVAAKIEILHASDEPEVATGIDPSDSVMRFISAGVLIE